MSRVFAVHCQNCTPELEPRSPNRNPFKTNRRKPFGAKEMSANVAYTESIIQIRNRNKQNIRKLIKFLLFYHQTQNMTVSKSIHLLDVQVLLQIEKHYFFFLNMYACNVSYIFYNNKRFNCNIKNI